MSGCRRFFGAFLDEFLVAFANHFLDHLGTSFQYRCSGSAPLVCVVMAMPPWPGDDEAVIIDGPWVPHVDPDQEGLRSVPTRA